MYSLDHPRRNIEFRFIVKLIAELSYLHPDHMLNTAYDLALVAYNDPSTPELKQVWTLCKTALELNNNPKAQLIIDKINIEISLLKS